MIQVLKLRHLYVIKFIMTLKPVSDLFASFSSVLVHLLF